LIGNLSCLAKTLGLLVFRHASNSNTWIESMILENDKLYVSGALPTSYKIDICALHFLYFNIAY